MSAVGIHAWANTLWPRQINIKMSIKTAVREKRAALKQVCIVVSCWTRTECAHLSVPRELVELISDFVVRIDSKILTFKEAADLFERAFDDFRSCELLLRGSEDGFGPKEFHELCDRKGATLTVALSEFGHVIGGFTTVAWNSSGFFKRDTGAWLFVARVNDSKKPQYAGIRLPAILRAKADAEEHVLHCSDYGPTFGPNFDLCIANDSGFQLVSYCFCVRHSAFANECDGVTLSPLAITGGAEVDCYGKSQFAVVEYEVFACK